MLIDQRLREIEHKINLILELLAFRGRSKSATLRFSKGEPNMPLTALVTDTPATAVFQEWSGPSGTGDKLPSAGTVTFSSDNQAVATVDSQTGLLTYVAAGTANIAGSDAANNLSASDTLTLTAVGPKAESATLTLTAPKI